jgi:hypothetical protein
MILAEITERLVRKVFGGKASNEGVDYAYIESMVPKWRQRAILLAYNGSREYAANMYIAPEWVQIFTVDIPAAQRLPSNTNVFLAVTVPPLLRLKTQMDGLIFFGDEEGMVNFRRIKSTAYAADLQRRGDLSENAIGYVKVDNSIYIFGNKQLESATANAVLADPMDCPDFNIDEDDYPVSEDVIEIMERVAMQELFPEFNQPEDQIRDGVSTQDRRVNKINAA